MIDQTAEALICLGNRAMEQGNETLARSLYEEGLAIWRLLDDAPCMAYALGRLRTLEGVAKPRPERFGGGRVHAASEGPEPSTKWAGAFERLNDTGTPAGSEAPLRGPADAGHPSRARLGSEGGSRGDREALRTRSLVTVPNCSDGEEKGHEKRHCCRRQRVPGWRRVDPNALARPTGRGRPA